MGKLDRNQKLKKYIILTRESIVHNLDGDDRRKLVSEAYMLKPNTQINGGWREYERFYYKEYGSEGRGTDVGLEEGQSFLSVSGKVDDFIDLNFNDTALETHNVKALRTYPNQKFMTRNRETTFHKEYDIGIDENGNTFMREKGEADDSSDDNIKSDFSTIPAGSQYLYTRLDTGDGECICITDVGYWLKNDAMNDTMIQPMSDSLDNIAPAGWAELMENTIEPCDGDFDALEKALQSDPDWGSDPTFDTFITNSGV